MTDERPELDRALADVADAPTRELDASSFTDLEAAIAKENAAPLASARAMPTPTRVLVATVLVGLGVFGFGVSACRHDLDVYPASRLVTEVLFLTLALCGTLTLALRPLTRPALRSVAVWGWILLTLALALLVALIPGPHAAMAPSAAPEVLGPVPPARWTETLPCMWIGLLVGVPVYLVARFFDRGHRASPWLAAAGAGLAGNLALALHCPSGDVAHKLTAHASLGIIFLLCLALARAIEIGLPSKSTRRP